MGVGSSFLDQLPEGGLEKLCKDLEKRATRIQKKRTKASVTQSIEQPDGKILEKRSDGSQRRISPDGTSVETFKDGSVLKKTSNIVLCKFKDGSMLQISDAGEIIEKNKEGTQLQLLENKTLLIVAHADGRQLQWDIAEKTGTEEHPDGTKLEWNEAAGNRVTLTPDGTVITTYSDGCVITKSTDGKVEQSNPDGTRIVSFPDGRRTQFNSDGSRIEFFPDGSRVDYRADGVVIKQGSQAVAKAGPNWEIAAANLAAKGGEEVLSDEDDYSDSEFEDAEVGDDDAVAIGCFVLRGARFKNEKQLSNVETKILKEALSVIPYEMGLDVTKRDVVIEGEPAGKGNMKITYKLRLTSDECDTEMAEEVFDEIEESLTEKGGTVFANALARTAKELHYSRWLTDKFAISYTSQGRELVIPPSWQPQDHGSDPEVEAEHESGHALLADVTDIARTKSTASLKMARLKRKLRRASKFKTLQGSIKIKGVSGSDFDRSNHHHNALHKGLAEIFEHLGLNESNLRIKLTNVLDSPRKDGLPAVSVDYHVTLRGNAKDQADSVVSSLKGVFGDSKHRKRFLTNYWQRIPEEVGTSPKRRKKRESGGSEAKGEEKEKRSKKEKKDRKRDKKDKKRQRDSLRSGESGTDSDAATPKFSQVRGSPINKLSGLAEAILASETKEPEQRMLPVLR